VGPLRSSTKENAAVPAPPLALARCIYDYGFLSIFGGLFDRAPVKLCCWNVDTPNRSYGFPLFILGFASVSEVFRPSFIFGIVEAGFCC
jgi:hypothetical protein